MNMQDIYNTHLRSAIVTKLGARQLRVTETTIRFQCYVNPVDAQELHMELLPSGRVVVSAMHVARIGGNITKLEMGAMIADPADIVAAGRKVLGLGA